MKALSDIILNFATDDKIRQLCKRPDGNFDGRKIIRAASGRYHNPTRIEDQVGAVLTVSLQEIFCSNAFMVSTATYILTDNPGEQGAHCDNPIGDTD